MFTSTKGTVLNFALMAQFPALRYYNCVYCCLQVARKRRGRWSNSQGASSWWHKPAEQCVLLITFICRLYKRFHSVTRTIRNTLLTDSSFLLTYHDLSDLASLILFQIIPQERTLTLGQEFTKVLNKDVKFRRMKFTAITVTKTVKTLHFFILNYIVVVLKILIRVFSFFTVRCKLQSSYIIFYAEPSLYSCLKMSGVHGLSVLTVVQQ